MSDKSHGMEAAVTLQLQPELASVLDRLVAEGRFGENHADALRQVLRQWAADNGYLANNEQGIRPEDLNAANDD